MATRYSFALDALTECPCQLSYDAGQRDHYVWIAFLHYDNDDDEYRIENEVERQSWAAFEQWATCVIDGSSIFHCQLMFWDASDRMFNTFSIDVVRNRVFSSRRKRFQRGWTFVRLHVTAAQELAMYNFFVHHMQRRTPFNRRGSYALLFRPVQPSPLAFTCSHLAAAALRAAGFLLDVPGYTVSPASLHALVLGRRHEFRFTIETSNPTTEDQP